MNAMEKEPNSLTAGERLSLEIDRSNARVRMVEVWSTFERIKKMYSTYSRFYHTWKRRFEEADLALAMDRRTILEPSHYHEKAKEFNEWKKKKKALSRDDLLMLLAEVEREEEENKVDDLLDI